MRAISPCGAPGGSGGSGEACDTASTAASSSSSSPLLLTICMARMVPSSSTLKATVAVEPGVLGIDPDAAVFRHDLGKDVGEVAVVLVARR